MMGGMFGDGGTCMAKGVCVARGMCVAKKWVCMVKEGVHGEGRGHAW